MINMIIWVLFFGLQFFFEVVSSETTDLSLDELNEQIRNILPTLSQTNRNIEISEEINDFSLQRFELLKNLVKTNPKEAKNYFFDENELSILSTIDSSLYEKFVDLPNAQFFTMCMLYPTDNEEFSREYRYIKDPTLGKMEAFTYDDALATNKIQHGVIGWIVGNYFLLDPEETLQLYPDFLNERRMPKIGSFSLIYYIADFPDVVRTTARDKDYIVALMDEINSWYKDCTYNQFEFGTIVVTENQRLSQNCASYSYGSACTEMKNLAKASNSLYDSTQYDYRVCSFTRCGTIGGWAGLGSVGGGNCWINGYDDFRVVSHELGHNVGFHHANGLSQLDETSEASFGGNQGNVEYADLFSDMGSSSFDHNHFNFYHKYYATWARNDIEMKVFESNSAANNGKYTLYAHDHPDSFGKLMGLRFKWREETEQYLYVVSHRSKTTRYAWHKNGAVDIHMSYKNYNKSHLVDTKLYTGYSRQDAPVSVGQTYVDDFSNPRLAITTLNRFCPVVEEGVCPGETCASPCFVDIYLFQGAAGSSSMNIKMNSMIERDTGISISVERAGSNPSRDILFADVTKQSNPLAMCWSEGTTLYSQSLFVYLTQMDSDIQFQVIDYTVSDYRELSNPIKRTANAFGGGSISIQRSNLDKSRYTIRAYTTNPIASFYLFQNDVMIGKIVGTSGTEISQEVRWLPGYNVYYSYGHDGTYLASSSCNEKYEKKLSFALNYQKTKKDIKFTFHPAPALPLNKIILFAKDRFDDNRISFDRISENMIGLSKGGSYPYFYPTKVYYDSLLSFEFMCTSSGESLSISFQNSAAIDGKNVFTILGSSAYPGSSIDGYKVEGINIFQTVEIPIGSEYYERSKGLKMNFLYLTIEKKSSRGLCVIKDVRLYDNLANIKKDTCIYSGGCDSDATNSVWDSSTFTYEWSADNEEYFDSKSNNVAVLNYGKVNSYINGNASRDVQITLVVKNGATIILEETFSAEYVDATGFAKTGVGLKVFLTLFLLFGICVVIVIITVLAIFVYVKGKRWYEEKGFTFLDKNFRDIKRQSVRNSRELGRSKKFQKKVKKHRESFERPGISKPSYSRDYTPSFNKPKYPRNVPQKKVPQKRLPSPSRKRPSYGNKPKYNAPFKPTSSYKNRSAPIPPKMGNFKTVLSNYHAQKGDEINVKRGQKVKMIKSFNDGWSRVEISGGKRGMVPSNYLK